MSVAEADHYCRSEGRKQTGSTPGFRTALRSCDAAVEAAEKRGLESFPGGVVRSQMKNLEPSLPVEAGNACSGSSSPPLRLCRVRPAFAWHLVRSEEE